MVRLQRWIPRVAMGVAMGASLACADEPASGDDEAGTTGTSDGAETSATSTEDDGSATGPGLCGDGVVDPDEACDDGNRDENDGCTSACELGPCGFEWLRREPTIVPYGFGGLAVEGDSMLVISESQTPAPYRRSLVRATTGEGEIESVTELAIADDEWGDEFLPGPRGDLFILSQVGDPVDGELRVARVSGVQTQWQVARSSSVSRGLALDGAGELVFVSTETLDDTDSDARLTALDPVDGAELWSASYSGAVADDGNSLDYGFELAAGGGALYMAAGEYLGDGVSAPTIVAFAEGGGDPLWSTRLVDDPGGEVRVRSIALGPEGRVLATVQGYSGDLGAWVFALDPASGAVLWSVDFDDLPTDRMWPLPAAIAANDDTVMVTGNWSYFDGGQQVVQTFALGLDLDGGLRCMASYDEYDPSELSELRILASLTTKVSADGDFVLAGVALPFFEASGLDNELMIARVRG